MPQLCRCVAVSLFLFCGAFAQAPPPAVEPGTLPKAWPTGGPNCMEAPMPDWQVHEYNLETYILRESGCSHWEKPFIYLLIGKERALLEDSGAGRSEVDVVVQKVIAQWARRNNRDPVPITLIHSHSHGDHNSGDPRFARLPNVTIIPSEVDAIRKAAGIRNWPGDAGVIDLGGGRIIDVIPMPGHDPSSIALYDRRTGILFTGDSMYPGRIYIRSLPDYAASLHRLVDFTHGKPVAYVMGTHIEQTRTPFLDYKVRTTYQPDELPLQLTRGDLLEAMDAVDHMNGAPALHYSSRFTLVPKL